MIHVDNDPGIVEQDKLRNGRLLFLSKSNNNHKRVCGCRGEEEVQMREKHLYTDYSPVKVNRTGENGVVMDDKESGPLAVRCAMVQV
jgi:hypothetical protein